VPAPAADEKPVEANPGALLITPVGIATAVPAVPVVVPVAVVPAPVVVVVAAGARKVCVRTFGTVTVLAARLLLAGAPRPVPPGTEVAKFEPLGDVLLLSVVGMAAPGVVVIRVGGETIVTLTRSRGAVVVDATGSGPRSDGLTLVA
jgi:hypothetical protein